MRSRSNRLENLKYTTNLQFSSTMRHLNLAIGIIRGKNLPRIVGDQGNPATYEFFVKFKDVGCIFERLVRNDQRLFLDLIRAAKELEKEGVRAITSTCGFTVIYQKELANAVKIPVFTSSLLQVPLASKMIKDQRIGIITASAAELKSKYLRAAGINASTPIAIAGLENKAGFRNLIYNGTMDTESIKKEVIEVSQQLVSEYPDIGAIVFECANLPPYAQTVQDETGLPVFDIYTLTKMMVEAVHRRAIQHP